MFARQILRSNLNTKFISKNLNLGLRFKSYNLNPESIVSKQNPSKLLFTKEHEWISINEDGTGFIGITNYASDALGDATFIELPSHQINESVESGETISSVESVKSASDIYSPINCKILEVNESLDESPALINSDPMGEGWIVKVEIDNGADTSELLDGKAYETFVEECDDH